MFGRIFGKVGAQGACEVGRSFVVSFDGGSVVDGSIAGCGFFGDCETGSGVSLGRHGSFAGFFVRLGGIHGAGSGVWGGEAYFGNETLIY